MVNVRFGGEDIPILTLSVADISRAFNTSVRNSISALYSNSFDASESASIFDHANLTPLRSASIFDHANLTPLRSASIFDHANLTVPRLNEILAHPNLTIQKGQEILERMVNPDKPTTTERVKFLADDWSDNKITARDRASVIPTAFGFMAKRFRPVWTQTLTGGSPTISLTDGMIRITTCATLHSGATYTTPISLSVSANPIFEVLHRTNTNVNSVPFWLALVRDANNYVTGSGHSTTAGIQKIALYTASAGIITSINSGVAVTTGVWRRYRVEASPTACSIFEDGVLRATSTTNIPTLPFTAFELMARNGISAVAGQIFEYSEVWLR